MTDQTHQLVDELRFRIADPGAYLPRHTAPAGHPVETIAGWAARAIIAGIEDGTIGYVPAAQLDDEKTDNARLERRCDRLTAQRDDYGRALQIANRERDRLAFQLANANKALHALNLDGKIALTLTITGHSNWDGQLAVTGFATERTATEIGEVLARALANHTGATVMHQWWRRPVPGSSRRAQEPPGRLTATKIRAAIRAGLDAYPNSLSEGMDAAAVAVARLLDQRAAGESKASEPTDDEIAAEIDRAEEQAEVEEAGRELLDVLRSVPLPFEANRAAYRLRRALDPSYQPTIADLVIGGIENIGRAIGTGLAWLTSEASKPAAPKLAQGGTIRHDQAVIVGEQPIDLDDRAPRPDAR